jgi:hypothetical protein
MSRRIDHPVWSLSDAYKHLGSGEQGLVKRLIVEQMELPWRSSERVFEALHDSLHDDGAEGIEHEDHEGLIGETVASRVITHAPNPRATSPRGIEAREIVLGERMELGRELHTDDLYEREFGSETQNASLSRTEIEEDKALGADL